MNNNLKIADIYGDRSLDSTKQIFLKHQSRIFKVWILVVPNNHCSLHFQLKCNSDQPF